MSGTQKPEVSPLIEATVHVLEGAEKRTLNRVALNKALFYLDLYALRDLGSCVTGAKYIALKNGPVVGGYEKKICRKMVRLGLAEEPVTGTAAKPLRLVGNLNQVRLNDEQVGIAHRMGKIFSRTTADGASKLSHENAGWHIAWAGGGNRQPEAIDMYVALQQLAADDPDPWLDDHDDEYTHAGWEAALRILATVWE